MVPPALEWFAPVVAFFFGAAIGSFLNVVIYRLPRAAEGLTLSHPRLSMCPKCGTTIKAYDNIPLISYIALGAKCRACKVRIPFRYFFVELLTALLFAGIAARWQPIGVAGGFGVVFVYAVVAAALVSIAFIDADLHLIPDRISLPFLVLAPLAGAAAPELHRSVAGWLGIGGFADIEVLGIRVADERLAGALSAGVGIGVGVAAIALLGGVARLAFRKAGVRLADAKLLGLIGGFLGWKGALMALLVACAAGLLTGLGRLAAGGEGDVPFGAFLAGGAIAVMLWRPEIVRFMLVG